MKLMANAASVGVLALLAACSPFGGASVFRCDEDTQCAGGVCQADGFCSFADATCPSGQRYGEHSGSLSNTCVGSNPTPDSAPPDMCTAGAPQCFGHAIETCNATGTGFDPDKRVACPLTCVGGTTPECVAATNIPATDQATCNADGTAPALSPPTGATVRFDEAGITCTPSCGAVATIARTTGTPHSFYCLSSITIPANVTFEIGDATSAITLFATGDVSIASDLAFDGGDATASIDANAGNDLPGQGGPGGFRGGALANQNMNGNAGLGPCPGQPGAGQGSDGQRDGGGGGGAANNGDGGAGGNGQNQNQTATGGDGGSGGTTCSPEDGKMSPFVGGSGGGGGADGACGPNDPCGWPGGGGGGALHVVSRTKIEGTGTLSASGGNGAGIAVATGGGSGGGAGGFLLLEAPTIGYSGVLRVDGGDGGRGSVLPNGGAGATGGDQNGGDATDSNVDDTSGPGGGGGGGRIRINAMTGASCATASPSAGNTCTTGALRSMP